MFDDLNSGDDETSKSTSTHAKTWTLGQSAFKLIQKHDTSADPKSYSVWYAYAAGKNPKLNKAIDEVLEQNVGISSADIRQMYDLHLAEQTETEEKLESISQAIETKVAGAKSLVTEVISNTDDYVSSLDKAKDLLPADSSPEQIRGAIDGIIEQGETSKKSAQDIQVALQSTQDEITDLNSKVTQLRTTLRRDSVTELMNQQKFETLLKEKSAEAINNGYSLTVLVANVQNIQELNQAAGIDISEFIMKSVSGILQKSVNESGVCARFAGAKFAIMLPRAVYRDAAKITKAIIDELELFKIVKKPSDEYVGHINCSMGGASLRPDMTPGDLISAASEQAVQARRPDKSAVKFDLRNQKAA